MGNDGRRVTGAPEMLDILDSSMQVIGVRLRFLEIIH